ncbi:MAG: hypothetical protein ACI9KE_004917, partial [Polyangiales bacterium]
MPNVLRLESSWHLELNGGLAIATDDVVGAGGLQLSHGWDVLGFTVGAEVLSLSPERGRWAAIGTMGIWMRAPIRMEHTVILPGLEFVGGLGGGGLGDLMSTFRTDASIGVRVGRVEPFLRAGYRFVGSGRDEGLWHTFDLALGLRIRIAGEPMFKPRARGASADEPASPRGRSQRRVEPASPRGRSE